jgi:hypothetical protein
MNSMRLFFSTFLLAFSLHGVVAHAATDEQAVASHLESFRNAQFTLNSAELLDFCATELSYSHSDGRIEDRSTFVANATSGKSKFLSLHYNNPTIQIVGNAAIVRFNWVGEQQRGSDGVRASTNLHILMIWQKRGEEWKLVARSATKL